jgi:hypothetical protein
MSSPKWEPGAVKLVDGSDAIIHYVQHTTVNTRYIGMRQEKKVIGGGHIWVPMAWTVDGYEYLPTSDPGLGTHTDRTKLVPPPKRTMRIKGRLYVYNDMTTLFAYDDDEVRPAMSNLFASFQVDEFIREGEGL